VSEPAEGANGAAPAPLLRLDSVDTFYGPILNLHVGPGELVCLLGGNASGKSTTLKTVLGIVRPRNGSVLFDGEDITSRATSYRISKGIAIVPENRRLFGPMTVLENLEMGAYLHGKGAKEDFDRVYELFPLLHERRSQLAATLSHQSGIAILVVEQNANVSLSIADRGYVLSTGRLVLEGPAAELREHEDLRKAYLGR
jgi:branched-chain amino acid transport system ATP-binding protein